MTAFIGRADFMAHGRQKGAFGSVGFIGTFFGGAQIIEQLPPFADVDPAANDALHFTARVTVGKNPVIDRQLAVADVQRRSRISGVPSATTRW